jgi:hypothetical protein
MKCGFDDCFAAGAQASILMLTHGGNWRKKLVSVLNRYKHRQQKARLGRAFC